MSKRAVAGKEWVSWGNEYLMKCEYVWQDWVAGLLTACEWVERKHNHKQHGQDTQPRRASWAENMCSKELANHTRDTHSRNLKFHCCFLEKQLIPNTDILEVHRHAKATSYRHYLSLLCYQLSVFATSETVNERVSERQWRWWWWD